LNARGSRTPAWKSLLALLCLLITGLLWLNGLLLSLEKPTVTGALDQRQLELRALAMPAAPPSLQPLLTGVDPLEELRQSLLAQDDADPGPGQGEPLLQLALLQQRQGQDIKASQLRDRLQEQIPSDQRALVTALERGQRLERSQLDTLQQPWSLRPLTQRLLCEGLSQDPQGCGTSGAAQQAVWRLVGVSWAPGLLLLLGVGLLLRQIWQQWRGQAPAAPRLEGPPLDLVDVTLLIAGGFVVLGELTVPLLLSPALGALLSPLNGEPALQQGLQVLLLYLGLMLAPLTILWAQMRGRASEHMGEGEPTGGLQWHWRPFGSSALQALQVMLMLLPMVALVGWITDRIAGDQGGSNPLLELVLTTGQPLALACFALTAVLLAPLFEETLFRGVLLPVLGQRVGPGLAVLLSALIFAAAHLSLNELAPLMVLGLGLGWLRLRSGRLGSCVLVHALWNGFTFANLLLLAG
jgi:membrane protease YdiL (CAAX protease family)